MLVVLKSPGGGVEDAKTSLRPSERGNRSHLNKMVMEGHRIIGHCVEVIMTCVFECCQFLYCMIPDELQIKSSKEPR